MKPFRRYISLHSRLLHCVLGGISPSRAIELAEKEVIRAGGTWTTPVFVDCGWSTYRVTDNILVKDGSWWVFVRRSDGEVIDIGSPTRYGWRRLGRCDKCGYDLTGNLANRCPECGAELKKR